MADIIRHQGIVEDISGTHLKVRIVQTSACASCSIKGHCTSADTKEKVIDATVTDTSRHHVGEHVWVEGRLSMGTMAVALAFVAPFFIIIIALFGFMALLHDELVSSLCSLGLLIPYYYGLWLNRNRMAKRFTFSVSAME